MQFFQIRNLRSNFLYFKKLYYAIGLVITVLLTGIIGFYFIEDYSLLDSVFMTVITVATVGYLSLIHISEPTRPY